jgi:hypothetical protein
MYGPSARECFAWCSDIDCYDTEVRRSIRQTSWDTLAKALISAVPDLGSNEGPHRIILVAPKPEDHFSARTTVVTKYISQLLWDADAAAHRENHRQLFKTLILAPAFIGQLIEPAFHRMCVRGYGRFILHPMSRASVGPVNYTFKTSEQETLSEVVRPNPRELFPFNNRDPIPVLDVKQYYLPTIPDQCSYDSFIYDLDRLTYGHGSPIDRDRNFGRVIAFQIAEAMNHDVKLKGLHALRAHAQELGINGIRLVIVVAKGSIFDRGYNRMVTCSVEKTAFDQLKPKIYVVEVDEHDLYAK